VRLSVIGRRDRLSPALCLTIANAEAATAAGRVLHLRIAFDYSSRESIMRAAQCCAQAGEISSQRFAHPLGAAVHEAEPAPNVDLLIRTGGEQRLSDFLLWECAYAELFFSKLMWPDFKPADFESAVNEFRQRERRFGSVPETSRTSRIARAVIKPRVSPAEQTSI
jgi:undecaprenyl diphosphate synthase